MGVATSKEHRRLLDNLLRDVMKDRNTYHEQRDIIPQLYKVETSESAWEEYMTHPSVPDIPEFTGKLTTLNMGSGWHTKIEHKEFAGQLMFERKLVDDEKYGVMKDGAAGLMDSAHRVRQKRAIRPIAYATSTAFDFMESEEGVALASNSHLTKVNGISTATGFDNLGTSALNKTSIAATRILMRKFRTDIGERYEPSDNFGLIVPDDLADAAEEVNKTPKSMDTANGNVNMQAGRYKVIPLLRLSDYTTTSWGMVDLDLMKKQLIFLDRIKPEPKSTTDWDTYAQLNAIYTRFSLGFTGWRWMFWNQV